MKPSGAEFVAVWQNASSLEEVAEKTATSRRAASMRAAYYRKHGVDLKKFVSHDGPRKIDWEELKRVAGTPDVPQV